MATGPRGGYRQAARRQRFVLSHGALGSAASGADRDRSAELAKGGWKVPASGQVTGLRRRVGTRLTLSMTGRLAIGWRAQDPGDGRTAEWARDYPGHGGRVAFLAA